MSEKYYIHQMSGDIKTAAQWAQFEGEEWFDENHLSEVEAPQVKVGDFFYDIYGYDATLVDFFQVVRVVSQKTLELKKVSRQYLSDTSCAPTQDDFKSDAFKIRMNKWGRWKYSKWDGKPKYISAWGTY